MLLETIHGLWLRIRGLFRRRQLERDLDDEIQFHLAMREEKLAESGVAAEEAPHAARRRFGNATRAKETNRELWTFPLLETFWQDIRYGVRQLRLSPGFAVVAIVTLALGIGANTAIFTLVDTVMLKSLPVASPNRLYRLGNRNDCCVNGGFENQGWDLFPYPLYLYLRDHTSAFSDLAAFQAGSMQLTFRQLGSSKLARSFEGEFVSGNYFRTFGIRAFAGRVLTPQDDHQGAQPVAVMGYRAWRRDFGLRPTVIGKTFAINTVPFTVIGVAPPGFFGDRLRSDPPEFWLPLSTEPILSGPGSILNGDDEWLYSIGRLEPGADRRQVEAQLRVELQQWLSDRSNIPAGYRREITKQFIPLARAGGGVQALQSHYAAGLRLLVVLAGVVLLIASANIANLLLARGTASRLDAAVRVALGAPRRRLVRQVLTESVLLAALGGLAGLYLAYAGARAILLLAFNGAHYVPIGTSPSLPVLGFAFGLSLATAVVFGVVPAWVNSRSHPADVLKGAGRSAGSHASFTRRALVVIQVALCTVLLASAGLLTESLRNLRDQSFGYQTKSRWVVKVNPALAGINRDHLYAFYQQLEERLRSIPGVLTASYSLYTPTEGCCWSGQIQIEGRGAHGFNASWLRIGPGYFATMGIPLIRGRTVTERDGPTSQRVAVVNQTFARMYFPHQDPIGQHLGFGGAGHAGDYEIVGVVGNARYGRSHGGPAGPMCFIPFLQDGPDQGLAMLRSNYMGYVELRVAGEPKDLEANVRHTLASINPSLSVLNMMTFSEELGMQFNEDRLMARLTELFALLALVLACVGLYGVTSYSVAQRTNEIGIRMALGASRDSILGMVLSGALAQVIAGLAIGVPVALAAGDLLSSLLYGVKSSDPWMFIVASLVLVAAASLAAYVPARRATYVDPVTALKYE